MWHLALVVLLASPSLAQVRVLFQNDLSANITTPALLISEPTAGGLASLACSVYSEQPLPSVSPDIHDQLNYLVFRGQLTNTSLVYIGGAAPSRRLAKKQSSCNAYSVGIGNVTAVDCSTTLPVLCTNSAPAFSVNNTTPATGSQVSAAGAGASFNGFRDARSFRFLGIPFAAPPIGDLRFSNAQPYNGTYSNYSALTYGQACVQSASPFGVSDANTTSEDCLNLNIFSPVLPTNSSTNSTGLPVAFWMYGGSFVEGTNNLPDYDGGNMASRGDVVVVTTNYRIGPLGNMASPALNGSQGNSDQIQALQWVHDHIATFGGDPSQVTIFGQSAGAQSTVALLGSTPASTLFSAAISESGLWLPFVTRDVYTEGIYPTLLNATNCTNTDATAQLTCLRALPAATFRSAALIDALTQAAGVAYNQYAKIGPFVSSAEPFLPVVGTGILDGLPSNLFRNGTLPGPAKSLMIGTNENEGVLFVDAIPTLISPVPANISTLQMLLSSAVDPATVGAIIGNSTVFPFNATDPDTLRDVVSEIVTQYAWLCPLQQQLGFAFERNLFSSLYSYRLDKGIPQNSQEPSSCTNLAVSGVQSICHTEDISEVFGNSNARGIVYDGTYNSLPYNQYVNDVWTSFIRTHNPQLNLDYQTARGRSYNGSLALAQATPFGPFNPNSTSAVHHFDLPPSNSGLVSPQQCQVLAGAGFYYDKI